MQEDSVTSRRRRLIMWIVILLLGGLATVVDIFVIFPNRKAPGKGVLREVEIPKGIGPKRLAETLSHAGVISSQGRFFVWLRVTGQLAKVRAGTFLISDNMTPGEVLTELFGSGVEQGIRVTVPEGYSLRQIGAALEHAGLVGRQAFIAAALDQKTISELGIPGVTAEGFLFPDTYFFDAEQGAKKIIKKMHTTFKERFAPQLSKDALKRVVTLASIVQAEAQVALEMPVIAGVYTNRLNPSTFPSQRLQADPTVSYGCEPFVRPKAASCASFSGTLTRRQLDDPTNPYNTYRHPGLPPGPICSPGLNALKAAQNPAVVPFLYFVVSRNGHHTFSPTLEAHRKAVARYRKSR